MSAPAFSQSAFGRQLKKYYTFYTGGFILFLLAIAVAEQLGMSRAWIGYWFLFATIGLYAGIGWMTRTQDVAEYYVAGRKVPSFFNGMATGADWMSAASFIGMAGTLFLQGYDGLAWVMGWTGGFCLVALFLAPYLRKFGQFTIPDFLAERYGGNIVRFMGVICAITCSFVYVIAQIYGVGLIVSRMTGLEFGVGVFVGLAGILVCAMLGGMRAVTWTQVAQYIVLIIAYLTPIVILTAIHWLLLTLAVVCLSLASGVGEWSRLVLPIGIGAALILPALNAISLLIPNAAVLLFPSWFQLGRDATLIKPNRLRTKLTRLARDVLKACAATE